MLLVYTESLTPRLVYVTDLLFRDLSGLNYRLTNDRTGYLAHTGPRINYARNRIHEGEIWIEPQGLLQQQEIVRQDVVVDREAGYPCFFRTQGDFPFDIFAAAFYLVSRYEEYLPHATDGYGRFDHSGSLAFREGFLQRPLVNEWMKAFRARIRLGFPDFFVPEPVFRFVPTYDIDIAYAYRHRPLYRHLGGILRDLARGERSQLHQRWRVLRGREADPFDLYEWLDALHLRYRLRPIYFFLLAAKPGRYDRNLDPAIPAMKDLVQYHAQGYTTGIHPSWQSGDQASLLLEEINRLSSLTGMPTTRSRQHYLRFTLPGQYRQLEHAGIRDEYSMGYGKINGFRASIAAPFPWYDLREERCSSLILHPFAYMDSIAMFEEDLTPSRAFEVLQQLHNRVKDCGGTLYTICHNHFLGNYPHYRGWKEVYELFLEQVIYWDV